jgi:hypothetical protein
VYFLCVRGEDFCCNAICPDVNHSDGIYAAIIGKLGAKGVYVFLFSGGTRDRGLISWNWRGEMQNCDAETILDVRSRSDGADCNRFCGCDRATDAQRSPKKRETVRDTHYVTVGDLSR